MGFRQLHVEIVKLHGIFDVLLYYLLKDNKETHSEAGHLINLWVIRSEVVMLRMMCGG